MRTSAINLDAADVGSLQHAPPQTILEWAAARFPGEIAVSSSFQTQGVPLLHIIATRVPDLPVLFVDTGYHFPETIAFRDHLVKQWNLNLVVLKGDPSHGSETGQGGQPLYLTDPDLCCEIRKVVPVREAMRRYRAWISGIRRDQSSVRAQAEVVEVSAEGRMRIHPMLEWTQADVDRYMAEHDLPRHPLTDRGYTSIGCAPCTCPPLRGADPRSGRWQGTGKTECGLHTHLRDLPKEKHP